MPLNRILFNITSSRMVEQADGVQKWCGEILFLSPENIALNCEYCRHDFFTLETLRAHLNDHFPALQTIVKKEEDAISCGGAIESIPAEMEDDTNDFLTDQGKLRPSVFNNKDIIEQSVGNQRELQPPQRTCTNELCSDISRPTVHEETPCKATKPVENSFNDKKKYLTSISIKNIQQLHDAEKQRHKCSSCVKSFVHSTTLDYHIREKHLPDTDPRRYFECQQCVVKCKTYQQLLQHRRTHLENPTNFTCDYCRKQFELKRRMLEHIRNHFDIKPFNCTYCQKAFSRNARKNLHERTCYKSGVSNTPKDYRFKCRFCARQWETTKQLSDHENTHTGCRPHKCRICPKTFASHNTLVSHVKLHANDKPHKCSICEKTFARNVELDNHNREKHLPDSDPRRYFPCLLCDLKLKSYCQYKRHTRKHRLDIETFTCDYCRKQFNRKYSITQHMKVHSAVKPTCKYCQMEFVYKTSKKKHEQICAKRLPAIRKRSFECSFCSKTLCSRQTLTNHENRHTDGDRPYQCSLCFRKFAAAKTLRKHLAKVHTYLIDQQAA